MQQINKSPFLINIKQLESMTPEERAEYDKKIHEQRAKDAIRQLKEKIDGLVESSGLGGKFLKRTFSNFQVTAESKGVYRYFKNYADNFDSQKKGIYAWGNWGIGKTHLAAAVAIQLLYQGIKVLFIPVTSFKDRIYASYSNDETEIKILRDILSNELVVLDDFDKLNITGNTKEMLYKIINRLYEAEKKVIITANCNREYLAKEILKDGSISSRIAEMCQSIEMSGEDWRGKG